MRRHSLLALVLLGSTCSLPWTADGVAPLHAHEGSVVAQKRFRFLRPLPAPLKCEELVQERAGRRLIILIDDSRSMGTTDNYPDDAGQESAKRLGETIRTKLQDELPATIDALEKEIARAAKNADARNTLQQRLQYWQRQRDDVNTAKWRPNRLQLAQALLTQAEPNWLTEIVVKHKVPAAIYHLDAQGRAVKLSDAKGDVGVAAGPKEIERAAKAIANLTPHASDSRLGAALRQIINDQRGVDLAGILMFSDGVTTRDETIAQAAELAAQRDVPLFFVGLGDDRPARALKLHDLHVEDAISVGDSVTFHVRLTAQGFKDLTVPIILKLRDKSGKEKEVAREMVKVDPAGKPVQIRMVDRPKEVGRRHYIIEAEVPKAETPATRLERVIDVAEARTVKVLYVESQPRYEFRAIKSLLERAPADAKAKRPIELKVLLLDADDDFAAQDKTALKHFPPTLEELNQYDVLILGDCDPAHKKLKNNLKDIGHFVRGEDAKGQKAAKPGGGILFIAGAAHNPHHYKGTPLADLLPIEPSGDTAKDAPIRDPMPRPDLTPMGRMHPIFRFSADEAESMQVWKRLAPIYWSSSNYRARPRAEVLAVHPTQRAQGKAAGDERHPLVVQQRVGTGRALFFGFDETWRWRLREDEARFDAFWTRTLRHLASGPSTHTELRLDRQTSYLVGEPIRVSVRFPEGAPLDAKLDVKVAVQMFPPDVAAEAEAPKSLVLAKVEGSSGTYEGRLDRAREGTYRIWLTTPDVSKTQRDGQKPSAEAVVVAPAPEVKNLRTNAAELKAAAEATRGQFFGLHEADRVLKALPLKARSIDK